MASGLNIAAFNIGIAIGALGGGVIVERMGLIHTTWIGAEIMLLALGLTVLAGRLDRRDREGASRTPTTTLRACKTKAVDC